jgi:hypothetical protein
MAVSTFFLLRSVLQSPLENHLEGLRLLLLSIGANEEVGDGVSTSVNTAQGKCDWMKITKLMIKRNRKPA